MPSHELLPRFTDVRRLTGPNRHFAEPAVTLTPCGAAATDAGALANWANHVRSMARTLGWPDPDPLIEPHPGGNLLVFRAPRDAQLTATEVSEWAWEQAAAEYGDTGFASAHALGSAARDEFAARAAAERIHALVALRAAAAARALPVIEDDDCVSIGAGCWSRCWRRDALPEVDRVPWEGLRDIPTVLVTGSNGKTTTVRLIAAIAAAAGLLPGISSTEGVYVGGDPLTEGDYSGPDGARTVLRDSRVTVAVLETARGGILRRGLAVERAQVAIVTNVRADHFGEYGIDSTDDLAETKLVVARAVTEGGTLVLNADDAALMAAAARLPHAAKSRRALFASDHDHPDLRDLRARGGATCAPRAGSLVLVDHGREQVLGRLNAMPLTHGGAAPYNLGNLAAAALASAALGIAPAHALAVLQRFGAAPLDNPGRLERWTYRGAVVLIDYAHNPDALDQLLRTARALRPVRLSLLLGQAGNRGDDAIDELARTAARFEPDEVIIKELPLMLRGRAAGDVPARLRDGLLAAGVAAGRIAMEPDEESAARVLLAAARPGDVVVLPIHTRAVRERLRAMLEA